MWLYPQFVLVTAPAKPEDLTMDLESLVTGAGGVAGVCAWVIVRQDRLIDALRKDLAAQQDASRAQVESVYTRLLDSMTQLGSALGALERAVIQLGRERGNNGESNGQAE